MSKEAKPDTWMPLVIGDYLKDTSRLNAQQHGAYLLLIMDYWVNGPPNDDDAELAKIAACELSEWKKIRTKIAKFFRVEDGVWRHKRVEAELTRWSQKKEAYAARASAGGKAKAAKSSASSTPKALLEGVLNGCLNPAPQPASTTVEDPSGHSTRSARFSNLDLRTLAVQRCGERWTADYLDRCTWQDVPAKLITAPNDAMAAIIEERLALLLDENCITVSTRKAA